MTLATSRTRWSASRGWPSRTPDDPGNAPDPCGDQILGLDPEWNMARLLACQPGRVPAGDLDADLGSRIASSDHQDAAFLELGRVPVIAGVQLDDSGIELG